jgi:hypothetical protein
MNRRSLLALAAIVGCGPVVEPASPTEDQAPGVVPDRRCLTTPVVITTHPHAREQFGPIGPNLVDTRGWGQRLYFGYGDINLDTGPIVISSFDPVTKTWLDHLTFSTERIERFRVIGDRLWATATDPHGEPDPDYAIGTADHAWTEVDIGRSIKVLDVAERTPGEIYLVGSDVYLSEAGTYDNTFGGAVWRSKDGGPFERAFPIINPDPVRDYQFVDMNMLPFLNVAALGGKLYTASVGLPWVFDGDKWEKGPQLGGFVHPITFREQIVFAGLGELWSFDGTHARHLGIELLETTLSYTFTSDPIALINDSEDRILVVNADQEVLVTTDLVHWECVGQSPPDVRSIGSLNGTVYFGGAGGTVYGYEAPSW